MVLSDIKQRSS